VVVAVLANPKKDPLFGVEDRVTMLKEATADIDGVEVDSFKGLLVDYARRRDLQVIVKGIRAASDLNYELQMAQMNGRMAGVETLFMASSPQWAYLSSSLIKEVVGLGADVSGLVPQFVNERLKQALPAAGSG
jgi:pantetheine-phosphate adenylyltransferase